MKCLNSFPQHSCNIQLCRKRWYLSLTRNNLLSEVSRATVSLTSARWGKSSKGPFLLSLKQYLNYVTASGCIYCGFMELWTSDLCLAYVQLSSFTSVCTKAMCMSSRVYEIAAELIWIHQCQNYKSPLTWKWTLVLSVPCGESKLRLLLLSFLSILGEHRFNLQITGPLPFFLSWPYDPKEAGLADLLINSQSPSLEALLHIGLLL